MSLRKLQLAVRSDQHESGLDHPMLWFCSSTGSIHKIGVYVVSHGTGLYTFTKRINKYLKNVIIGNKFFTKY